MKLLGVVFVCLAFIFSSCKKCVTCHSYIDNSKYKFCEGSAEYNAYKAYGSVSDPQGNQLNCN